MRRLNEKLEELVWKKTQEATATESRFHSITENSTEAITLTDNTFTPFYQNRFAEDLTGWTELTKSGASWIENTHRDDKDQLKKTLNDVIANAGKRFDVNFRTQNKHGHYIYIEGTISNMLPDKHVKAIVLNFRDITERKEIEEKLIQSERIYRTIGAHLPDSIITILDKNNTFLLAEGEGLAKLGLSKETSEGKREPDALPQDLYAIMAPLRKKAFSEGMATYEIPFRTAHYLVRFIPLNDENENTYAVMTISLDITGIKKAETEIKALNETLEKKVVQRTYQLEMANKELEAFTYSVSHDLRAPLRIIQGYADILKMDHSGEISSEGLRLLGVIINNIRRMGILIDELLNFSKLGRKEVIYNETDMNVIVREVIEEQRLLNKRNVEFKLMILHPAICDKGLLRNVWNNLISNAVKYSSNHPTPTVEISSSITENQIVYNVKDNGVGFDMKYSHKLFGVFQRLHKKTEFEGTGVGLALVQRIITKHEGKVWAEAEENKGATFFFSLPIISNHGTTQDRDTLD